MVTLVETLMWWALVLASSMSILPRCVTCRDGVFRVPLTLQHDYNETAMHTLQSAASGPVVLGGQHALKKKNTAFVEVSPLFTGLIKLGGKYFEILFDTGSNDMWVYGTDVNKERLDEDEFDHVYYNYMEESTTGEPFKAAYGTSESDRLSISGVEVMDTLNIGDIELNSYRIGVVNKLEEVGVLLTTCYDGTIGLNYKATETRTSVFTSMVQQGLLHKPMFSVYVAQDGTRGEIIFGAWDDQYFTYPIELNEVVPMDGRWAIRITKLVFFDTVIHAREEDETAMWAIVDTGSSNMHLPSSLLVEFRAASKTLNAALDLHSGTYGHVLCAFRPHLPPLKLEIGSRVYELTGEEYTTALGSQRGSDGNEWCRLLFDGNPLNESVMVIGIPFLTKYYTMFYHEYDGFEGPVVAFAEATHPGRGA